MSSEVSRHFEGLRDELRIEIEINNDLSEVIRKLHELHRYLTEVSPNLSAFEKEKYGIDITHLVQQVADKERIKEQVKPKVFEFKRKASKNDDMDPIEEVIVNKGEMLVDDITMHADLTLSEPNCSFVDLSQCKVTSDISAPLSNKVGSLTFHRISHTAINLQNLPFTAGNISITECQQSVIILMLPENSNIQIRLHNLHDCKLYIWSSQKQEITMDGCYDCYFHSSTESRIHIHDFSNLELNEGSQLDTKSYCFMDFDVLNMNTDAIQEKYINTPLI